MSKPRLLFLDFPFHSQTRSSDFFLEILARRYEVIHEFLENDWNDIDGCVALVRRHNPVLIITWQVCLRSEAILALGIPCVWVPMLDNVSKKLDDRFVEPARIGEPMVAFSKAHVEIAEYWGLPCLPVTYFPAPAPAPDFTAGNSKIFFWYRGPVQPAEIAACLVGLPNLEVVIKHDPDPPYADAPRKDGELAPFITQVVTGFLPKEEYTNLVASCGIYVGPRKSEGIGLSFLEAMARGALVLAYDAPTMNEYLRHGKNGWLFSETDKPAIPADQVQSLRQASYQAVQTGYKVWQAVDQPLLEFLAKAPTPKMKNLQLRLQGVVLMKKVKKILGA